MHPLLAMHIHGVLYLCIDYTFKWVSGDINEWKVVGFSEHLKHYMCLNYFSSFCVELVMFDQGILFAILYCDQASQEAFFQLFAEFAETIKTIMGTALKF